MACRNSPFRSMSYTSALVRQNTSMSSVASRCRWPVGRTPLARKQWQRLSIVEGLGAIVISSVHSPPMYPVSSCSSRRAPSSGVSPFSTTPAQISMETTSRAWRYWRSRMSRPSSVSAMTLIHVEI